MNKDGVPIPSALSGHTFERLIRIDEALVFLVVGALTDLADRWSFEETGALTSQDVKDAISDMLWCFMAGDCDMTPIGAISMWGTATVPSKWLMCDGSAVSRATYADLFSVIGVTYGGGDGSTTFNLPNFLERSPMGVKASGIVPSLGSTAGEKQHTQTVAEMPAHDHGPGSPITNFLGARSPGGTLATNNGSTVGVSTLTGSRGGGNPFNVVHPVLGVVFMIYAGK